MGGWVGDRKMEENEAVGKSYWTLGLCGLMEEEKVGGLNELLSE